MNFNFEKNDSSEFPGEDPAVNPESHEEYEHRELGEDEREELKNVIAQALDSDSEEVA